MSPKAPGIGTWSYSVNMAFEIPIAVVAILGNLLVMFAVYKNRHLRSVTNSFIVSLALADFLVGLVAIPFALITNAKVSMDKHLCLFLNSFIVVLTQISILSLLAIAVDRYFAVVSPLKYRRVANTKRALCVIIVTWVVAFIVGLVPVMGWHLEPKDSSCNFVSIIDMNYMVYFNFFGFVLPPLVIMLCIYIKIFSIVRQQIKQISKTVVAANDDEMAHHLSMLTVKEGKAARALAIVIILFAVCWLPLHILNSISLFCKDINIPYVLLLTAIILSHANSAMNPFVYAYSNNEFRRTFKKVIGSCAVCKYFKSKGWALGLTTSMDFTEASVMVHPIRNSTVNQTALLAMTPMLVKKPHSSPNGRAVENQNNVSMV
ncbi:adenosine receptor A1-like [Anneissia japonica]|uniref:adenosine receptor A1-like n=1 Tax=Anneissia japonica TaxID=1529436 RepID=UPI001425A341|nr:adenosine receptor A1-like [Anneissia japonica]XP_033101031.1 adenosine receptor A1-like [Anneissia japonica]XP_033101032.1 adenosine receptor A1-like [Anneissia japonica]XP_033101034.1 adenosine receptor A1-like [Anneissia japonica]